MKRFAVWILVLMFFLGFLVRLYRFDGPIADWHSFRQSDTNAVSQIYVRDGVDLLYPRFFDISNLASGIDNPKGYRYVEFPIFNALQASLFNLSGILTLVEWGRVITIFASLSGAFFVYLLTRKYANEAAGLLACFFYLFLPFSIYYGRVILPDPSMTASILAGIYFFDKWLERSVKSKDKNSNHVLKSYGYFVLSILFTALAFLFKPYVLVFSLPIAYLAWKKYGLSIFKQIPLWVFAVLTLTPVILWRIWIGQHPEGIPSSAWLFNGDGIRLRPAFFRWIFYERITRLILGFSGIVFLIEGVAWTIKNKNGAFFLSFLASTLIYVTVIATGNVRHDYYQISIIPTISIFAGLGVYQLFKTVSKISNKYIAGSICLILIVLCLFFSWKLVRDYFNINDRGMVAAGIEANKVLPKNAVVVASQDGSTTMLNLIQRPGWPLFEKSLPELIDMGANYMVLANPSESDINGFARNYETVASGSSFLILKLK